MWCDDNMVILIIVIWVDALLTFALYNFSKDDINSTSYIGSFGNHMQNPEYMKQVANLRA